MLMFASVLIGAMPRMGKTFALRILMLACALDPNARLRVWELKGTGDLSLRLSTSRTSTGPAPTTRRCEGCLASVRKVYAELDVAGEDASGKLPKEQAPENKVTPEAGARSGAWACSPMS